MDADGNDVQILEEGATAGDSHEHGSEHSSESSGHGERNCHFHAGVEYDFPFLGDGTTRTPADDQDRHCIGAGESESGGSSKASCGIQDRDYDVPLRIGTLFVVLVTSSIGVSLPMLLARLPFPSINTMASTVIKQFGTGVIISTAFIHVSFPFVLRFSCRLSLSLFADMIVDADSQQLYTHANLMFTNDCLGELGFEGTTSAIVMAGIFISFLTEYIGHRVIIARSSRLPAGDSTPETGAHLPKDSSTHQQSQAMTLAALGHNHGAPMDPTRPNTKLSVLVMEAGVIFHSVLIGVTLVVAGDSFYKTLLVVIVFHQFFEGMALGARIALLPGKVFPNKALMAAAFALITPIGMAIGIGVLHSFNGNERSTLLALGTLDALSAGILVWVGVVDMWARDWVIDGGELLDAPLGRVATGGIALIAGMALMGLLGKWA